jgi:hypothetical protein
MAGRGGANNHIHMMDTLVLNHLLANLEIGNQRDVVRDIRRTELQTTPNWGLATDAT